MAEEIVERMLELPPGLVVSQFELVDNQATKSARSFIALWRNVYNDPRSRKKTNHSRLEAEATHSVKPDTKLTLMHSLKTVTYFENNQVANRTVVNKYGMDVIDPDGGMNLTLDLLEQPLLNVSNDPFAVLIMDCFRSHLVGR